MQKQLWTMLCLLPAGWIYAQICHVVPPGMESGPPADPYNSWTTAATSIQDAVTAAATNGWNMVLVSNGTYYLTNEIAIANSMTVRSWNNGELDRDGTVIDANNFTGKPVTNRCFYLDHAGASLAGFTIRGGSASSGGGVFFTAFNTVSDCLITGNNAVNGGGMWAYRGGTLADCIIASNNASSMGGGIYIRRSAPLKILRCEIIGNIAGSQGGGIRSEGDATDAADITLSNCVFVGNQGANNGGAIVWSRGHLSNSLLVSNSASYGGGVYVAYGAGYNYDVNIESCTLADNTAVNDGGGIYCGTIDGNTGNVLNTLIYRNSAGGVNSNWYNAGGGTIFNNCCTSPLTGLPGADNIDANPAFASPGDYRLSYISPCLNAGHNQDWMIGGVDLGGQPRIDRMHRRVDIGCYEYMPRGTLYKIR